ncbi:MAG: hypothetical protein JWN02_139, partial [Acidobacteria bacterium]|nr:hypothetical protein [Acidobacteriota bacterium]
MNRPTVQTERGLNLKLTNIVVLAAALLAACGGEKQKPV